MNNFNWGLNTLAGKLIIGFSVVLGLSIGVNIFAIVQLRKVQNVAEEISENWMPSINTLSEIKNRTSDYMLSQQQHIFSLEEGQMQKYEDKMRDDSIVIALKEQEFLLLLKERLETYEQEDSYKSNNLNFTSYKDVYRRFLRVSDTVVNTSRDYEKEDAKEVMLFGSYPEFAECANELDFLIQDNNEKGRAAAQQSSEIYQTARLLIQGMSVLSFVVSVIIAFLIVGSLRRQIGGEPAEIASITRRVSQGDLTMRFVGSKTGVYRSVEQMVENMRQITSVTNRIAEGDLAQRLKVRSDKDVLALSINQMIDNFKDIIDKAKQIAKGDYSIDIKKRGQHDELGASLSLMTDSLRTNRQETTQQNWIKDGLNALSQEISGNISVNELSDKAVSFLARYTASGQGVLYIFDEENQILKCSGTFAYTQKSISNTTLQKGEGIVGQVAKERKAILLKDISKKQTQVLTGTSQETALNTFTIPLIFEHELYGVYELASFEPFTEEKQEFLTQASLIVATYLYSALQNEKVRGLLAISEEATRSAETRAKEIEEVNSQLEEQRKQLEIQSDELQTRNQSLIQAKEELDRRAEELEISNRYKSEFLANMSHELRTPLNSIIMLSKMLGKNEKQRLQEKDVKKAQIIHKSGAELLRLINDILDLSKIEAGKMAVHTSRFTTTELLNDMDDLFHTVAAEQKIKFQVVDKAQVEFYNDKNRMTQIIRNFLSNAFKFTKKGSVTLEAVRFDEKQVKISVIDTGIGIAEEKQAVIFEAFKQADGTTSRTYGGTGLGLSIARELSRLLQASIELESEVDGGSRFSLLVPIRIDESQLDEDGVPIAMKQVQSQQYQVFSQLMQSGQTHEKEVSSFKKIQDDRAIIQDGDKVILVVEDEAQFAESMADIIRGENIKVLIAQTGQDGLDLATTYKPAGIILDLGLPDMQGEALLAKFKSTASIRHIPIEIVSAQDKDMKFLSLGARGFLQKPIDEHALKLVIADLKDVASKATKNLLVVEDDPLQLEAVTKLLQADDVLITGVTTEQAAIQEIKKGMYDGAVVDLSLEDGDGEALCEFINENYPKISVIVYTARSLSPSEERRLKQAARSIVPKSEETEHLLKDEVALYLHRMEQELDKENAISKAQNTDSEPLTNKESFPAKEEKQVPKQQVKAPIAQPTIPPIDEKEAANIIKKKTILVVDDDIRNIFVIASALENFEATILEALSGKEGLATLQEESVDLVLMDALMPEMNGFEAIQAIRADEKLKHLPIIAITGKAQKEDEIACLQAGANGYIVKPVNYDELLAKVCYWIQEAELDKEEG